ARLRAQAGTVAEQVARAQGKQVVVAVAAAVVVQGQLAGRAEFERAAHTLGVTQRRQHRLGRAGGALLVQPGQLDRERRGVVRPPLAVELALLKRLPALLGAGVAAVQAQRVVNPAQELGAVFLARQAGIAARHRVAGVDLAPPGAGAPLAPGPTQFAQVGAGLHAARLAFARSVGV